MFRWTARRVATVGATALLVTALGTGAASAAETPAPSPSPTITTSVNGDQVTITTDLATARTLCVRVGAAEHRLEALVTRIQADASTPGSAAYLRARAQRAASAGHDDLANVLNARATRRADRVDGLQRAVARLKTVDASVCDALPGSGQ